MEELIPITLFMCSAAVLILRPMTKRVGSLLEVLTQERRRELKATASGQPDHERLLTVLDRISTRMDLLEERMEYAERLYAPVRRATLEPPVAGLEARRRERVAELG